MVSINRSRRSHGKSTILDGFYQERSWFFPRWFVSLPRGNWNVFTLNRNGIMIRLRLLMATVAVAYGVASGVLPKQWHMLLVVSGHPWAKRDKATSWIGTIPLKGITPPQHIRIHTITSCLLICLICYLLISYLEGGTSHHIPSLTSGK